MTTKQELYNFEADIVKRYLDKQIRSPVHLSGSINGKLEDFLINLFKQIKPDDWIFTTYRSHYHAILKGVNKDWLVKWILDNKSIHLMNSEHRIVSTAIVGGTLSQAIGTALAIKLKNGSNKVWCFLGDMAASLGVFQDCFNYARYNHLPITFIIEDNGLSTDTPTTEAWGTSQTYKFTHWANAYPTYLKYIRYNRKYAHYGVGQIINFEDKT